MRIALPAVRAVAVLLLATVLAWAVYVSWVIFPTSWRSR
jgi:hypothetical protein